MAGEQNKTEGQKEIKPEKNNLPLILFGGLSVVAVAAFLAVFAFSGPAGEAPPPAPAEYVVKDRMYQLKDGSYLRLSFSIVVDVDKLSAVQQLIEKDAPSRLPDSINMIVANKTRNDLISGSRKRESFVRELKSSLEERVFGDYNRSQESVEDTIEVREILISDFVTQQG